MTAASATSGRLKQALHVLAKNDLLWRTLWLPMARLGRHMSWQRSVKELQRIGASLHPDYRVHAGPFQGLRYPEFKSTGSALLAKLLGTYEAELFDWVAGLIRHPCEVLVDVGCAEGYYAVGLALRMPHAQVFAFDTNPEARRLCLAMAALNGVQDRVTVGHFCTPQKLAELVQGKNAVVISDCEGGEGDLFKPETLPALRHCRLLVEAHDFVQPGTSRLLQERFAATHECAVVHSMTPLEKAERFPSPLIQEHSKEVLAWLYNEGRPEIMEWLLLHPRASSPHE